MKAMLRSMSEVILPAIPADNSLALDQATIIVENIKMLLKQCGHEYHYHMAELREYSALADELLAVMDKTEIRCDETSHLHRVVDQCKATVDLALPSPGDLSRQLLALKFAVESLLETPCMHEQNPLRNDMNRIVLKYAEKQLLRERAWFFEAGFDLEPESVPPIGTLLAIR